MKSKALSSTIALLLLSSHKASAEDISYRSYGQVSPCQGGHSTNVANFDMSFSPSNATVFFNITGLATVPGNATLSISVTADGDEVYQSTLDPCIFPLPDLCPASGDAANLTANIAIPKAEMSAMEQSSSTDVKGRISLDIHGADSSSNSSCVETALRSDPSGNGNGTNGAEDSGSGGDTTASGDSGSVNGTSDDEGSDVSSSTQASSASSPQAVSYVAM
jgi:hypothetical protein